MTSGTAEHLLVVETLADLFGRHRIVNQFRLGCAEPPKERQPQLFRERGRTARGARPLPCSRWWRRLRFACRGYLAHGSLVAAARSLGGSGSLSDSALGFHDFILQEHETSHHAPPPLTAGTFGE